MIEYKIPITQPDNLQKIVTLIENKYSVLMHESETLPSTLTLINGFVGITSRIHDYIASSLNHSYTESTLHVVFFETNNYAKRDSNGNIVYQGQPLSTIPNKTEIESLLTGLI